MVLRSKHMFVAMTTHCAPNGLLHPLQSGKLVQKMFGKIQDLIADKEALICVLIDEVGRGHGLDPP